MCFCRDKFEVHLIQHQEFEISKARLQYQLASWLLPGPLGVYIAVQVNFLYNAHRTT